MDARTFDRLARLLGGRVSRRTGAAAAAGAAGAAVAAAAGLAAGGSAGAARRRPEAMERALPAPGSGVVDEKRPCGPTARDNRCFKDSDCCTYKCQKPKEGEKFGRCRCIKPGKSCTRKQMCCGGATCENKVCTPPPPPCLPTVPAGGTATANGAGLTAALAAAPVGATLILAPGEYAGDFTIQKSVTLTKCPDAGEVVVMNIATYVSPTPAAQGRTFFVGTAASSEREARQDRLTAPTLTLDGITVTRNVASGDGGGIFVGAGASLYLVGSSVIRGTQNSADGAAIEAINGYVYVGCDRVADPACTDSVLIGDPDPAKTNRALGTSDAAAIQVTRSTAVIRGNARLSGNIAGGSAGAIYMTSDSNVLITDDAQITNNQAGGLGTGKRGGAIRMAGGTLALKGNARVSGNSADEGGAIQVSYNSNFSIGDSAVVTGNTGFTKAGGLYLATGTSLPAGVTAQSVYGNTSPDCNNVYDSSTPACLLA